MIYMSLSNNPSSGDINSSNLPCFLKNAGQKNCTKNFQPYSDIFFKQIKKLGWKVKTFQPIFFVCLYFIGMGGDENLKYLAWPYFSILVKIAYCKAGLAHVL